MRYHEARELASTINGDYYDWEAKTEEVPAGSGYYQVVATFEEGGVHRLNTPSEWDDVKALVYGYDEEDEESGE